MPCWQNPLVLIWVLYRYIPAAHSMFAILEQVCSLRMPFEQNHVLTFFNRSPIVHTVEQGWCSGESTRPPPMRPGVRFPDSLLSCGLNFLLVLFPAPRGFSPGTLVFPSPKNQRLSLQKKESIAWHIGMSSIVWTVIDNSNLANWLKHDCCRHRNFQSAWKLKFVSYCSTIPFERHVRSFCLSTR